MPPGLHKKIAVVVRGRNVEALRMALGLTLLEDRVSVFIMDEPIGPDDEMARMSLEGLMGMGAKIYTNCPETRFETMSTESIARELLRFDTVIPY